MKNYLLKIQNNYYKTKKKNFFPLCTKIGSKCSELSQQIHTQYQLLYRINGERKKVGTNIKGGWVYENVAANLAAAHCLYHDCLLSIVILKCALIATDH